MKRYRFVALAVILLALAAYLMHGKDPAQAETRREEVRIPRYATPEEYTRRTKRKTLMEQARATAENNEPHQIAAPRDPLLEVLPYDEKKGTVIVEASAIRYSAIGERLLECLDRSAKRGFDEIREETGVDFLEDLDRIGISDGLAVMSGRFQGFQLREGKNTAYGDHGLLMENERGEHVALWNNELLIVDASEEEAKLFIDRLEGRAPRAERTFPEHMQYGEVYGWMPIEAVARMLPDDGDRRLSEKLEQAAERVELHVSVQNDVGIVARVHGRDDSIRDLGKSIGGSMALARTFAASNKEKDLAEILELGRVVPSGSSFDVEVALPSEILMKHFGKACGPDVEEPVDTP